MGFLFSTETNEGFKAQTINLDWAALRAAASFGIENIQGAKRVEKRNALSTITFIDSAAGAFVLRGAGAETAQALDVQCRVVSALDVATLRPLATSDGASVANVGGQAWIAYPYIDGPLFVSDAFGPMDALGAALNFQAALGGYEGDVDALHVIERDPEDWGILATRILKAEDRLSDDARAFVTKFRGDMARLSGLARTAKVGEVGLAHCDLQHANVVVAQDGPAIIDLEDICLDSPAVCAAHAIFKMARHAVYAGLMDVAQARAEVIAPGVALAHSLGLIDEDSTQAAAALAALRTLGDVHNILTLMGDPATAWVSYDLEKKVQNVFEIDVLFSVAREVA